MSRQTIAEAVAEWFDTHQRRQLDLWHLSMSLGYTSGDKTPWSRIRRAVDQLIWDGHVIMAIKVTGNYRRNCRLEFRSARPAKQKITQKLNRYASNQRMPLRGGYDLSAINRVPIYARVPIVLADHPRGATVDRLTRLVGTTQHGTVEANLWRLVWESHARLQLRRLLDGEFVRMYTPNVAFHPTVSDYYKPAKAKKAHSKPIKQRIMAFLRAQLEKDGEIRPYTPERMNLDVEAAETKYVSKRCCELANDGDLKQISTSRYWNGSRQFAKEATFELGFRDWMLWQGRQRTKKEQELQKALSAPRFLDSDMEP